jgi:putative heme-binding domain-containing protein
MATPSDASSPRAFAAVACGCERLTIIAVILLLVASAVPAAAAEPQFWKQQPEAMPTAQAAEPANEIALPEPGTAPWIWGPDDSRRYRLTKAFTGGCERAVLVATCDNSMRLLVNGQEVARSDSWDQPIALDVTDAITPGDNEITAVVTNGGGPAGFCCRLVMTDAGGGTRTVQSDDTWTASEAGRNGAAVDIRVVAEAGGGPWGDVLARAASAPPPAGFAVPKGFAVERLFVVPQEELGSWVSLATDPQGRLIASDQGDKGLVRITPAALDGSTETLVERIPAEITGAQGLLWAFDALYVVCNGGTGSGLYRVTDSDGNDTLDAVEKLRAFDGGGEHGPHNILISPDGQRLFIICGNHTEPPFAVANVTEPQTMGGIRESQRRVTLADDGSSRLPANWDEDTVIARMWDGNGHAAGRLAPGGYIVSTDPDGKTWELWSAGYRNPYDFGFNADGELFAYDADMEWDFGTPWYRPTRVNHATSGSELGWRSGTAKWSPSFPDSLPAIVDIGPGSPVGAAFGYGTRFPAKYQKAFYVCDWTFGTMYAIHLEPDGASYRGTKEEFVSRTPLPLTDMTVGRDGAIYFTVGGRGGQSELYRVTYRGDEPTDPVDARGLAGAAERKLRRELEALHMPVADSQGAIDKAVTHLGHPDRFIRYAARIALEHQPVELWQEQALAVSEPLARITAAVAVARQAEPSAQEAVLEALEAIDPTTLDTAARIDLVRAYELAMIRLGEPSAEWKQRIAARIAPLFPSGSYDLDRAASSLLVAVRAPGIVTTLVGMLAEPTDSAASTNLAPDEEELRQLIQRNAGYGSAVREALEKRGDLLQIHYAYVLRTVAEPDAWTDADRRGYFEWFGRAREWAGGNSYRKFLTNIENENLATLSETEKMALETLGIRKPYVPPPLPAPEGPGRKWTTAEVLAAAERGLDRGRSFEHGQRTFAAARCIVCHRFGEDGGATGPDLTQAGGRFQLKDLVEALVEPSKVVSDQYKASIVQTVDGKVVSGRIVAEFPERIVVVTDPEDATKFVEIERAAIEEILPATQSLMPAGLLDQLSEDEVLDLLAYTLSRGNANDRRFRK